MDSGKDLPSSLSLSSKTVMELMPDSDFIRSLDDSGMNGVKYLSIGGSSSSL